MSFDSVEKVFYTEVDKLPHPAAHEHADTIFQTVDNQFLSPMAAATPGMRSKQHLVARTAFEPFFQVHRDCLEFYQHGEEATEPAILQHFREGGWPKFCWRTTAQVAGLLALPSLQVLDAGLALYMQPLPTSVA